MHKHLARQVEVSATQEHGTPPVTWGNPRFLDGTLESMLAMLGALSAFMHPAAAEVTTQASPFPTAVTITQPKRTRILASRRPQVATHHQATIPLTLFIFDKLLILVSMRHGKLK